jgi:SOS-response transcriptional repressor LexA
MPIDQPPIVIVERVIEAKPGTVIAVIVNGEVVKSWHLPSGPLRIAVEDLAPKLKRDK